MFGESMQTLRIVVAVLVLATISKAWISGFKNRKFNNAVRSTVCMSKMIPLDQEPPLKILLLVEPTPFNYISGYANRFKEMLNYLAIAGDKVAILTPDPTKNPPKQYNGFPITSVRGFEFVLYNQVTLSFDLRFNIPKLIKEFQPDLIHVSTPSALICPAVVWAKLYNIPLVMSYHTHFPEYAKAYASQLPGSLALANWLVKLYHDCADLTLCTSPQLKQQLESAGIRRVDVWQKGINTKVSFSFLIMCKSFQ